MPTPRPWAPRPTAESLARPWRADEKRVRDAAENVPAPGLEVPQSRTGRI